MNLADAQFVVTVAIPWADGDTVSPVLDTGKTSGLASQPDLDVEIAAPSREQSELPDGETLTYSIIGAVDVNLNGAVTLVPNAIIQTGAAGNGSAAVTRKFRLPTNAPRYVCLAILASENVGESQGSRASLRFLL